MVVLRFDDTNMIRLPPQRQTYLGSSFELSVNGGIWRMKILPNVLSLTKPNYHEKTNSIHSHRHFPVFLPG